ncbi:MAG: hypothetical protein NZ561_05975, partial [Phycisphaerae bacterium]|nr:hypothetical protein [Phycisphaerae bacterium]
MPRISRVPVAFLAIAMLLLPLARAENPLRSSVLTQLPESTLAVLKFSNLQATSRKLSNYATELGVA